MPRYLRDLVHEVSDALNDLELGSFSGGTAALPADSSRSEPDGYWTGGWLYTNGEERRITGWTKTGGVFTTNSLSSTPADGQEYEARKHSHHRRAAIVRMINTAIREVSGVVWVRLDSREDLGDTSVFLDTTHEYAVPVEMEFVHAVLYQAGLDELDQTWYPLDHLDWDIFIPGYISLNDSAFKKIPDGSALKILGTRPPKELFHDNSQVEVPGNYPVLYATAQLALRMASGSDGETYLRVAQSFAAMAETSRPQTRELLPSGSRRVR
jgi:hypothetical protein